MNNYPPGVSSLPGEEICECVHCGAHNHAEDYVECTVCSSGNVCPKCLRCEDCYTQLVTCECGSEQLIGEDEDCCSECYDEDTTDVVLVECPECGATSSSEEWDRATQIVFGTDSELVSNVISGNCEEPASDYWFICPACDEQAYGDKLKVPEEDDE
jgi:hypothetical protein